MLWHEQSWPAIAKLNKDTPVLIPLGSCEQHGHHLPLFVDTVQVEAIAEQVDAKLGEKVLRLPTLWLGCSHHHMDFPGTLSLPPDLYEQALKQLARSVLSSGFTRLFFLNGHGGNSVPAASALTALADEDERADAAHIVLATWWELSADLIKPAHHGMHTPGLTHACEYETSLMLHLRPDLVAMDRIGGGTAEAERPWTRRGPGLRGFRRFHRFTASGHMGEPAHASAEKGRSLMDAVVDRVASCIEDVATWPEMPVIGPEA